MTDAMTLATAAGDRDPHTGLRVRRKLVDQLERAQVRSPAPRGGRGSWAEVAKELGVSRQAAFKKHHGGAL